MEIDATRISFSDSLLSTTDNCCISDKKENLNEGALLLV